MSDHLPDVDKWPTALQWALNVGVLFGGAIMAMLGYRRRRTDVEEENRPRTDDRELLALRAELDRVNREIEQRDMLRDLEEVMRATRQGIYNKIDQRADTLEDSVRRVIDGPVAEARKEIGDLVKRVADLTHAVEAIARRPTR